MPIPLLQSQSTLPALVQPSLLTFFADECKRDYRKASALHIESEYIDILFPVQHRHLLFLEFRVFAVHCPASLICHSSRMKTISI